jgi:phage terminase large subunit-like protein
MGAAAAEVWSDADEAAWIALHAAQFDVEPLGEFIARVNPKYPPPSHLDTLINLLERARHGSVFAVVSMPPRHRKTTTCLNGLAHLQANDPALSHAFVTYNQKKARTESRHLNRIARRAGVQMDRSRRSVDEWGILNADGAPGGTIWAAGWKGGLTGVGITGLLLIDDPVKDAKEVESKQFRDDQWAWFTRVAMTRLEPGSSCIIAMTRWHEDDIPGRLVAHGLAEVADELKIEMPEWEVINLAALCDDEEDGTGRQLEEALWPAQFPASTLRYMRHIDPDGFEALYQGHPRPPGGRSFRDPHRYSLDDLLRVGADGARMVISVDPAASDDDKACHWAATLLWAQGWGADEMKVWMVDLWHERADPIDGAERLLEFQRRYGVPVVVEGGTVGKAVISMLRRLAPALEVIEVTPEKSKWMRAQPAARAWNRGLLLIPLGVTWADTVIGEAQAFVGRGSAAADIVDAMSHGYNYLLDSGAEFVLYGERASHMPIPEVSWPVVAWWTWTTSTNSSAPTPLIPRWCRCRWRPRGQRPRPVAECRSFRGRTVRCRTAPSFAGTPSTTRATGASCARSTAAVATSSAPRPSPRSSPATTTSRTRSTLGVARRRST